MNTPILLISLLVASSTLHAAHTPSPNKISNQQQKISEQLNAVLTQQQRTSAQRTARNEKQLAQDKKDFEKEVTHKKAEIKRLQVQRWQIELEYAKQKLTLLETDREEITKNIEARKTELTHQAHAQHTDVLDEEQSSSGPHLSTPADDITEPQSPQASLHAECTTTGMSTSWGELNKKSLLAAGGGCIACAFIGIKMYNAYAKPTDNEQEKDAHITLPQAQTSA